MITFDFYRVGNRWVLKIKDNQNTIIDLPLAVFSSDTTDDEIIQATVTLAKANNILTSIDFKEN